MWSLKKIIRLQSNYISGDSAYPMNSHVGFPGANDAEEYLLISRFLLFTFMPSYF